MKNKNGFIEYLTGKINTKNSFIFKKTGLFLEIQSFFYLHFFKFRI